MINFINESKRIIRKASENNKLVIFVGAGVSANSGYPSWTSLVGEFANGLGIDTKNISSEDYLKIPQYYYNSRKEKEYYDVIFNKFNVKVKTNPIHDLIFELNPYHVVTTNYDELLEEEARNKGMFYDVVSKDKDLPYTPNNNMIIKMHGDLKNKNIVLKEDDYLSYFKNFKLIENYIKSLISTYTILFIGYSISDINVKYIFQWVKDILGNDFQQAYFLDVDENKKFAQIEYEYYKNRGINILYYSQIKDIDFFKKDIDYKNLTNQKGKNTYQFLKYLLDEDSKYKLNIDYAFKRLKDLNNLNQIRFKDVRIALNLETPFQEDGKIIFSHFNIDGEGLEVITSIVKNLFLEIKEFKDKLKQIKECEDEKKKEKLKEEVDFSKRIKIELITEVLYKSGIKKIVQRNENHQIETLLELHIEGKKDYIEKYILKRDYCKLDEYLRKMKLNDIDGNEEKYLDKAYGLYKVGENLEAYKILKKLSESCFINKKYFLYFISEFNRYHLGHGLSTINFITASRWGISIDMQKLIRKEINNIDLDNIYLKLPSSNRPSLFYLRDILNFQFIYSKINDTIDLKEKVEKNKDTIYSGIPTSKGEIYEFRNYIEELWKFTTKNRLMVDNYNEVKKVFYNYIESALLSHMVEYREEEEEESIFGLPGKVIKLEKIEYFTFFIMLVYLNKKDIKYLFEKYEVEKLEIEENDLKSIEEAYDNTINSILMEKNIIESKQIFNRFLYITSRIDIGKEFFIKLIDGFLKVIDNYYYRDLQEIYDNMLSFIINQNNNFNQNITVLKLEEILNYALGKIILDSENSFYKENIIIEFIRITPHIIENTDEEYKFKNDKNVKLLIRQMEIDFNYNKVKCILLPVYKLLNVELTENVHKIVYEELINIEKFDYISFRVYYRAVLYKVISSCVNLEEKILRFIDEILRIKNEEEKEEILSLVAILIINDLIKEPNRFNKYKCEYEKFSFYIDMDNYNYDNFKLEWIFDFSDKLHKMVSECKKARIVIKEKLKKEIIENKCDKSIKNIFFKYYD